MVVVEDRCGSEAEGTCMLSMEGEAAVNLTLGLASVPGSTEPPYYPIYERPETYIVPTVFLFIFVVGAVGNGTLVFLFIRYPNMRNVPNMYILSLALGDLLVVVFTVPFVSIIYITDTWPYGEPICRLSEFMRDVSVGVTVFTLTALSADRYLAIVDPVGRRAGAVARRSTVLVTAVIWGLSLLLAAPAALFSYLAERQSGNGTIAICYPFHPWLGESYPRVNVITKLMVYYLLPLLIISTFYLLMARHLMRASGALPGEAAQHQQRARHVAARRKVARLVLAFVIIFAVCYFPNHVFMVWFYFNPNVEHDYNHFWNTFRWVGFCLGFFNSCVNPIALYCISGAFRKSFNRHLFCCLCPEEARGRAWTTLRLRSSDHNFHSTLRRTDQYDMSTLNDKTAV